MEGCLSGNYAETEKNKDYHDFSDRANKFVEFYLNEYTPAQYVKNKADLLLVSHQR